jgi:hypothetical protein
VDTDEALSEGWSILVVGPASAVTDPDTVRALGRVRIEPERITGRRITAD